MRVFLVSHTHWDREWYRTFEDFRSRLVDVVDRVLDLIRADAGFHFLLDGQTVVLEDYLAIRPQRREEVRAACASGRLAIGPWYVQPDSLLPSGEAHVRNLLIGRSVGEEIGPVSRVAYTPDSFGHPAQFPQIFAGFGLGPFVYWRGNGDEIDSLPSEYLWEAPDGSTILAHHLWKGYFSAAMLPTDPERGARWLEDMVRDLAGRTRGDTVLLLNGIDHAPPDANTGAVCAALAANTGWDVRRAVLDDFAAALPAAAPRFRGELVGARMANLLAGVWSTRLSLKQRNRRAETYLEAWAEPWSALGCCFGLADERAALRRSWRSLLQNQAHDSICGCSLDAVHEQMQARYDAAEGLAAATTQRVLERLAGLEEVRATPWGDEGQTIAVFNPSPFARTDVVSIELDPHPWIATRDGEAGRELAVHPLLVQALTAPGFTVDGARARAVPCPNDRVRLLPELPAWSVEWVARDVPAFGYRCYTLRAGNEPAPDVEDDASEMRDGDRIVSAHADGTLAVSFGARRYDGLGAIDDQGDRGDSYDFDPVSAGGAWCVRDVRIRRIRHANGVQVLRIERTLALPAGLTEDRSERRSDLVEMRLVVEARLVPGVERIDLEVELDNQARDHRLRLLFPSGAKAAEFEAATTFDVARRSTRRPAAERWIHPAPSTLPLQGFLTVNGLTVAAPGLPEAEVSEEGVVAVTLVRAVGWLSRMDLQTRPEPAGPLISTPGAQCLGTNRARLSLLREASAGQARTAEAGLKAVFAGARPLLEPERSLLSVEPAAVVLSALKPAEDGNGMVLRLLNPTERVVDASVRFGMALRAIHPVNLDESPSAGEEPCANGVYRIALPPHALRSLRLLPVASERA